MFKITKAHIKILNILPLLCLLVASTAHAQNNIKLAPYQQLSSIEIRLIERINIFRQDLDAKLTELGFDADKRQALGLQSNENSANQIISASLPLISNEKLISASIFHAKDMVERFYLSQIDPDGVSPRERLIQFGYMPFVYAEYVDALATQGVLPEDVVVEMLFNRIIASLTAQNKSVSALFRSDFEDIGVSVLGFAMLFEDTWHNVYLLNIDVASEAEVDTVQGGVILGHVYEDVNLNGRYDYGEGIEGVSIGVKEEDAIFGPVFQKNLTTLYDGAYFLGCPVNKRYVFDIFWGKQQYYQWNNTVKQDINIFDLRLPVY